MRNFFLLVLVLVASARAHADGALTDLLKTLDSYRKELPPPQDLGERNGFGMDDGRGHHFTFTHLKGVAIRLGATTRGDCLILLTYLNDDDPRLRVIAAEAIEHVVHAFPDGMSVDDMMKLGSDGHREMIRRFVERVEAMGGRV